MRKYRPELTEAEKLELERLSVLDFSRYNETEVREEFLRPLLTLLGYRKDQDYSVGAEKSFSLHSAFVRVGRDRIKLDYITDVRKQFFWLIEAKDGSLIHKDELSEDDVAQAYFYSLHPQVNCRYFAVSNGWLFNLYDRDELDEHFTPLLSIRNTELPRKFLNLDRYLGSTQVLAGIKEKLLIQIEKVLSAEIALERLEEFSEAVGGIADKVRPRVLDNFRANAAKEESGRKAGRKSLFDSWEPWKIVETQFSIARTNEEVRAVGTALVQKVHDLPGGSQHLLLFEKVFLNDLRPVRYWYYVNALNFLLGLHRSGMERVDYRYKGASRPAVRDLLHDYLRLVFTRFESRLDLRLLTAVEGVAQRILSRVAILNASSREAILRSVEFGRYFLPEEEVAWLGPSPAGVFIHLVDNATLRACGAFLRRHYDQRTRTLRLELAKQELAAMTSVATQIERDSQIQYANVRRELGDKWGIQSADSIFSQWDPIIAATLEIIGGHDEFVRDLPRDIRQQIEHVVSIDVAGSTADFQERHRMTRHSYSVEERATLLRRFFSPDYKPHVA